MGLARIKSCCRERSNRVREVGREPLSEADSISTSRSFTLPSIHLHIVNIKVHNITKDNFYKHVTRVRSIDIQIKK